MNTSAPVRISDYISSALAVLSVTPKCPQFDDNSNTSFGITIQKENKQPNKGEDSMTSAARIAQKLKEYNQNFSNAKGMYEFCELIVNFFTILQILIQFFKQI